MHVPPGSSSCCCADSWWDFVPTYQLRRFQVGLRPNRPVDQLGLRKEHVGHVCSVPGTLETCPTALMPQLSLPRPFFRQPCEGRGKASGEYHAAVVPIRMGVVRSVRNPHPTGPSYIGDAPVSPPGQTCFPAWPIACPVQKTYCLQSGAPTESRSGADLRIGRMRSIRSVRGSDSGRPAAG